MPVNASRGKLPSRMTWGNKDIIRQMINTSLQLELFLNWNIVLLLLCYERRDPVYLWDNPESGAGAGTREETESAAR